MKTILAMGAHFDDVEIGAAGTIFNHVKKGDKIYIVVVESDEFRTGDITIRRQEQLLALKVLGIPESNLITFTSSMDDYNIIGKLDKLKPDIIYTMYENDTHQAHRRCSMIGQSVGRKKHITTIFYDSGSSYGFYPCLFNVIDFKKKIEIIDCFKTQLDLKAVNLDVIKRKESYWASLLTDEVGCYAEGFLVRKMVMEA